MSLSATVGLAKGQTFVSVSDGLDQLDTWTQSGAAGWEQKSGGDLPDGVIYFNDTVSVNSTECAYRPISNLYPETGTIKWRFSVVCNYANNSTTNFKITLMANDSVARNDSYSAFAIGTGLKTGIYSQLCLLQYHGKDYDILATTNILFDKSANNKDLEVVRTALGEWSINGEVVYEEPLSKMHIANYLAVEYKHSAAKAHGAFFVSPQELSFMYTGNTIAAKFTGAQITGKGVVSVAVDGRLDPVSASAPENYTVNNVVPDSLHFLGSTVDLFFDPKIFNKTQLTLSAKNIKQADGEPLPDFQTTLLLPMYGDIVINEIMCDISPEPANLPVAKYVELFNPTEYAFSLNNCAFLAGDYQFDFPDIEIGAGEYLLICRSEGFEQYAKTVTKFDDSKLTTKNKKLMLVNQSGLVVDSLTYTLELYNDKAKSSGGYSLERRDPTNRFMVEGNWTASIDVAGGTPGRVNSTKTTVLDNKPPVVLSSSVVDNNTLTVVFSKNIIVDQAKFLLNGNTPKECSSDLKTVTLKFAEPLREGENTLKIKPLSDLAGNLSADTAITFAYHRLKLQNVYAASGYQLSFVFNNELASNCVPRLYAGNAPYSTIEVRGNTVFVGFAKNFAADTEFKVSAAGIKDIYGNEIDTVSSSVVYHNTQRFDILITEVLFYPLSGQKRFVELYNNSAYPVPLNQFVIAYYDNAGTEKQAVIQGGYVLEPKQYAVVTADSADIQDRYNCGGLFVQESKLPAFDNSRGSIVLRSPSGVAIDSMSYNRSESNVLEINVQGVSLERVGFKPNSTDVSAWKYATAAFGYATPGLPNSNTETPASELTNAVTIVNELFTPDGDGYNDEVEIVLDFDTPDTAVDVSIYNQNGVHICTLASRINVGTHANFFWNGLSDSGDRCKTGIYVIYVKTISPNGKTAVYKKVCVLNRKY